MSFPGGVVAVSLSDAGERFVAALGERERAVYLGLQVEKRRRDWLGGRLAAKRAAQRRLGLPFSSLEILARDAGPDRGRPELHAAGARAPGWLSIAHAAGLAVAIYSDVPVGLDLERIEPRDRSFLEVAFTGEERARLLALPADRRDLAITAAWCRKEAYAKLLGVGLRADFEALGRPPPNLSFLQGSLQHGGAALCWALAEEKKTA